MATVLERINVGWLSRLSRHRGMLMPAFTMALILVILIPLPTSLMDLFLLVNIMLSGIVLLTVMYVNGPLEFSAFPSLLLGMTLFRLVLNIATTRLILTNGDAGAVIRTFGGFVASGSLIVAIIIFSIVVIIQFVVITKGATRIAEVAARFTLDGMPGKQMAIDADLNAGIITEQEAKKRRTDITRESDFYGAMDGASKFVRGDAVAGIIITAVNILGGVYVGLVEQGLTFSETLRVFTILTIGDGLVSQIPAFIVSVSAAMIVTRTAERQNLGEELLSQLTSQPVALGMTACFLVVLGLTPLPKPPLILLAGSTAAMAYLLTRKQKLALAHAAAGKAKPAGPEPVERHLTPDPMELNVGYGLIQLVDRKKGGDLLDRITNMRRQVARDLGIVVPPIRIRDDMDLEPNEFRVKRKGIEIGKGEVMPGHLMAINGGAASDKIHGVEAAEPAFGLPAIWITPEQRHDAEHKNYTVVEPTSVISTYLTELVKRYADELLTRNEVNRLLDHLKESAGKLVEEIVPDVLKPGEIQRVLQGLLRERVPIRDLESILEAISEVATRSKDPEILIEYARHALARVLCQQHRSDDGRIHCITIDPSLEELIGKHIERSDRGAMLTLPPKLQTRIVDAVHAQVEQGKVSAGGRAVVLLTAPQIRSWVRKMVEVRMVGLPVLSFNEIVRGVEVESQGMVVLADED